MSASSVAPQKPEPVSGTAGSSLKAFSKGFWSDRVAWWFAAVGLGLMALTLALRINPVEGSVVPRFLFENPLGIAVFWVLFVTCMPVWTAGMLLVSAVFGEDNPSSPLHWLPKSIDGFTLVVLLLQAITYFLLGKLIFLFVRGRARRKAAKG
jgi:hypothetical protein